MLLPGLATDTNFFMLATTEKEFDGCNLQLGPQLIEDVVEFILTSQQGLLPSTSAEQNESTE